MRETVYSNNMFGRKGDCHHYGAQTTRRGGQLVWPVRAFTPRTLTPIPSGERADQIVE